MKAIDELYNKYDNLISIRRLGNRKIVDFYPGSSKWVVDIEKLATQGYSVNQNSTKGGISYYTMSSPEDGSFEDLIAVMIEVFEHNIDIERKERLMEETIANIKDMFTNKTHDELLKLKIVIGDDNLAVNSVD
jgi:lambda repressor-like predicted transcriptional regulator